MSDKSVALKHFPNKSKTTELSFYLLIHCVSLKLREYVICHSQKMKGRMNY